jgi:hypothetical protein
MVKKFTAGDTTSAQTISQYHVPLLMVQYVRVHALLFCHSRRKSKRSNLRFDGEGTCTGVVLLLHENMEKPKSEPNMLLILVKFSLGCSIP